MAALQNTPPLPSPTLTQLQTTLSSLQTATHILAGLTHRNKNQHRGTKWWAPFDMLRRNLQKLTPDLEGAIQRAEVVPTPSSSKRKKGQDGPVKKTTKQPELARVVERAVWMKEALGGRAYEAFTQLTADRQFAQLGLVHIGVLAQVEAALAPLLPPDPEPGMEEHIVSLVTEPRAEVQGKVVQTATDLDLGVVVSREEPLKDVGDIHPNLSTESLDPSSTKLTLARQWHNVDRTKDKKRKKPIADEEKMAANNIGSMKKRNNPKMAEKISLSRDAEEQEPLRLELDVSPRPEKKSKPRAEETSKGDVQPKKKKKKKKGGDEFDELFSSLL